MHFRRALLALFVVSVGLTAVGSVPAHACECSNTARSVDETAGDIAFVGTLVEITDGAWQFEIEQWLTEPRGSAIGIASDNSNGCGLDLTSGDRVAVYANDEQRTNMCGIGDADAALAALEPPSVHPDAGPARYLIGPGSGPPHYWLTDAKGRIAAFLTTPQRPLARLLEVSLCPGGKFIAERWTDQVTVRNFATLQEVRAELLPPPGGTLVGYGGLVCRSNDGSEVLVARKSPVGDVSEVFTDFVEIAQPSTPLIEGRWTSIDIIDPGTALVTAKFANTRLEVLDLATGTLRLIDEARDIEEPVRLPARIGGYSASPSGDRVVFSIYRAIKGSPDRIDTFVWKISPSRQIAAYREEPDLALTRDWIGEDRIVTTKTTDGSRTVVEALTGKSTGDPAPQAAGPYVEAADGVLAVDNSRLVVLDGNEMVTVTQFSNEFLDGPLRLRRPVTVTAELPVTKTPQTTPLTTTKPPSSNDTPASDSNDVAAAATDEPIDGPTVQWAVTGILAGLLIVAAAVVFSRRMDQDSSTTGP